MLAKYILHIGVESHELTSETVSNWDQVTCAFSRKDFTGVIRSFSSKFDFIGRAYDLLLNHYLTNGLAAEATLAIYTITDDWRWVKQFEAPLDFASISWDNNTLSISAIDNSLAALISAGKSTKYEFAIGNEIIPDRTLTYDRVSMLNTVTHEIVSNIDVDFNDGSVAIYPSHNLVNLMVYEVGNAETYENNPVSFGDQNGDRDSYFLAAEKDGGKITLDFEIIYDGKKRGMSLQEKISNFEIHLLSFDESDPDNKTDLGVVFKYVEDNWWGDSKECLGCFASLDALKTAHPDPPHNVYAVIGKSVKRKDAEAVYYTPVVNYGKSEWVQGTIKWFNDGRVPRGDEKVYCLTTKYQCRYNIEAKAGTRYCLASKANAMVMAIGVKSTIKTSWLSRANPITIDAFRPETIARHLLGRITEGKLDVSVHIADTDARLPKTYILAGESIRGIPEAKFYSSFSEFCDFMQTVFGYTYYLGERESSEYLGIREFDYVYDRAPEYETGICPAENMAEITLYRDISAFLVYNTNDGKFYSRWEGSDYYNDPQTGRAREDVLFKQNFFGTIYRISGGEIIIIDKDAAKSALDHQTVYFVHRDSLFEAAEEVEIPFAKELSYTVDSSNIYSSVEVGYDKQDYDAECGRDEWNFSSTFSTGLTNSDKTLTLKSKYRADCYGIEFLAQKRSKDTTDDKSDQSVFFAHCVLQESISEGEGTDDETRAEETAVLKIDRSVRIQGALSDTVFNGEYSPYRCLMANSAHLCAMASPLKLRFASSEGNSSVVIDRVAANSDLTLKSDLLTLGQLSLSSGAIDFPANVNALFRVEGGGMVYRGYLMDLDLKYTRSEAAKYKLIIKDVKVCE